MLEDTLITAGIQLGLGGFGMYLMYRIITNELVLHRKEINTNMDNITDNLRDLTKTTHELVKEVVRLHGK